MNCLMGGMLPVSALAFQGNPDAHDPTQPLFWFRMSLALMVGALFAYPMNYWLVAHHLKHGMLTVRPKVSAADGSEAMDGMDMPSEAKPQHASMAGMSMTGKETKADKMKMAEDGSALHAPSPPVWVMGAVSLAVLAAGLAIALSAAP